MQPQFFAEFFEKGTVAVRIIPNAKKTEITERAADGSWRIRVAAPATENKANVALLRFIKKETGRTAHILQGEKARTKILTLTKK